MKLNEEGKLPSRILSPPRCTFGRCCRFDLLVPKQLHGLAVEEGVHTPGSLLIVGLVHLPLELGPVLGADDGDREVDDHGDEDDYAKVDVEIVGEGDHGHHHVDEYRSDLEEKPSTDIIRFTFKKINRSIKQMSTASCGSNRKKKKWF